MRDQAEVALDGSLDGVSELAVIIAVAVVIGLFGVVDLLLGVATFVGRNWARLMLMLYSVFATTTAFVSSVTGVEVDRAGPAADDRRRHPRPAGPVQSPGARVRRPRPAPARRRSATKVLDEITP